MQAVFRVDGSAQIGSGHVMRCLALAEILSRRKWAVHFICAEQPGHYCDTVQRAGFKVSKLSSNRANTALWELDDARQTLDVINSVIKKVVDWLIVDHYSVNHSWEQLLRPQVSNILVIDDLNNRDHDCDLLLNQNLINQPAMTPTQYAPPSCRHLLGPAYALLQPVYEEMRQSLKPRVGQIRRILVFFGGTDRANMTERALDALLYLRQTDITVDIVVGANFAHKAVVRHKARISPNIYVHSDLPDLAGLIKGADLALGAGGVTHWERMCLGLPSLVVSLSDNQTPINESLASLGLVRLLGHHSSVTMLQISQALSEILSTGIPTGWSQQCMDTVDGRGALRVCVAMETYPSQALIVRQVTLNDERLLLEWANDPMTRQNSFSTGSISALAHKEWLYKKLHNLDITKFYIIQSQDGTALGQVRFDLKDGLWNIDYSISPNMRGLRLGRGVLSAGINRLRDEIASASLCAQVKIRNSGSCRIFESLGFEIEKIDDNVVSYASYAV